MRKILKSTAGFKKILGRCSRGGGLVRLGVHGICIRRLAIQWKYQVILRINNLRLEQAMRDLSCGYREILLNMISLGVTRVENEGISC